MTDCLKSVVSRGIARSASLWGVQVGGKTGTTNDTADIWFCGFTPKYSAALWIGTDQNSEMSTTSNTAAYLWGLIMSQMPGVTDGEYRSMPDDVIIWGGEYYTEGTEPGAYAAKNRFW
jgi:penicillin-binding protein 1A